MRKQTAWLVSMLVMMVVLSAYYIVVGPIQPTLWEEAQTKPVVPAETVSVTPQQVKVQPIGQSVQEGNDYFINEQLARTDVHQKKTEEAMRIIADPQSTRTQVATAQQQVEQIAKQDRQENGLEERIREQGFRDALIFYRHPHVTIMVQSQENLQRKQVVQLISLACKHLGVQPADVSVAYRT